MSDSVKVDYGSLKGAIKAMCKLRLQLNTKTYLNTKLINESRGETYERANQCYDELLAIEQILILLLENTKKALENTGIQFTEAENEAIVEFSSIGAVSGVMGVIGNGERKK